MIKEISGDILLSNAAVIVHSVAPLDHFDSGLALSLRENYPSMVKDFRHYCHANHPKPGELFQWGGADGKQIISLMTQEPTESTHGHSHPGKASIKNLDESLRNLAKMIKKENFKSIAIPKLATGVGGLEWEEVKPLIHKHLSEFDMPIYLYSKFVKGQVGEEV